MPLVIKNNYGRVINNGGGRVLSHIKNMVIRDGKITIDGVPMDEYMEQQEHAAERPVYVIEIAGDIERMDIDECKEIHVTGNCRRVTTHMGDIKIDGDVDGDVHTNMGSIECGNVAGDAHTNMGSVHYRRD